MKKHLLFLFMFLFSVVGLIAQDRTITGKVTSVDDDLGLPGVSVLVKGTTHGTVTDLDGNYNLKNVSSDDVLEFSFVGFEKQEIQVGDQNNISITMKPSAAELDELVVTALGIKRQKREIGYSTEKLDGEIILKSNTSSVIGALSGRSAGVQVTTPNGFEGGSTRITIRGNNNLQRDGQNQPLIVVDGVPLANEAGLTDIGRGQDWGSAINNINQEDIENLNILKGPTASALYGSRGANGVIMITTKRGKKRSGIGVDYSYKYKMITPYRYRDVQNKYGAGGPITLSEPGFPTNATGDTLVYPGVYSTDNLVLNQEGETTSSNEEFGYYGDAVSWGPEMNGEMVKWWDGKMRPYSAQPDNQELLFHNGSTSTHNLAFSGGGEMGTMRVSLTRMDHKPIVDNSKLNQTTINIGARLNISKKVKADVSFSYFDYYRLNSPMIGEDQNSFSKGNLYSWPRSWKGIEFQDYQLSDGTRNDWGGNYPFQYVNRYLAWNYYNNNTTLDRDKYLGAFTLTYDITSWLNLAGRFGLDYTFDQSETRNKPADLDGLLDGFYQNQLSKDNVNNNDLLLTAFKDDLGIEGIDAKFSIGGAQYNRSLYWIRGKSGKWVNPWNYSTNNWEDPNTVTYTGGDPHARREHRWEKAINSVYAFLNLSFRDYVFLEATGRNDWSSTLPKENNSYFYPSLSLSFIPTTAFKFNLPWFNFWKIRGAIASTATDTDPYQLSFNYTTGNFGNSQTAYLPGTIPPIGLEPQIANSYEVGTNLGFLDNRIVADFTYYYIKSTNQILDSPIPISSGASEIRINNGVLSNNGIEVILNGIILNKNDMVLETGINFSRNRNYVVSLGDGAENLELADIWGLNGPAMVVSEGDEYGTIVGYDYIYHENGQPILNDAGTHYAFTDTRVPIGNASPYFIGGWTTRFSYKGFTITTLIDTKWGGDIYCGSYVIGLQTGTSPETLIERDGGGLPYTDPDGNVRNVGVILPGVYEDGTPNDKVVNYLYKYLPNAGGWGKFLSTPGIVENTWVKFREITLSYSVPQKFIQKTKVFQNLTVSIVGRDLFYIYSTLPDNINPEGTNGAGNAQGLEWASLPGTRAFTFGISAGF